MYYKIVEKFGPQDGEKWVNYLHWRGLRLENFDSVDSILRPDLFSPQSEEDWLYCVNENYRINLITDLEYAKTLMGLYDNANLIGVEVGIQAGYVPQDLLLGFDIIDGQGSISLLTNWGNDSKDLINSHIQTNGLICDLSQALQTQNELRKKFPEDPHAQNCEVWAIYSLTHNQH